MDVFEASSPPTASPMLVCQAAVPFSLGVVFNPPSHPCIALFAPLRLHCRPATTFLFFTLFIFRCPEVSALFSIHLSYSSFFPFPILIFYLFSMPMLSPPLLFPYSIYPFRFCGPALFPLFSLLISLDERLPYSLFFNCCLPSSLQDPSVHVSFPLVPVLFSHIITPFFPGALFSLAFSLPRLVPL